MTTDSSVEDSPREGANIKDQQTRIALINAPGRLPTVVHDVGPWWDQLHLSPAVGLTSVSSNFLWWRHIASPAVTTGWAMDPPELWTRLIETGMAATQALEALRSYGAFGSADVYLSVINDIEKHLGALGEVQDEFAVSMASGPVAHAVDYSSSLSIVEFSKKPGLLASTIEACLRDMEPVDIVLLHITSEFEVLTGAILASVIKKRNPTAHICLFDHGYENFSLSPHMASLTATNALAQVFDTIIVSKDEIDRILVQLIGRLTRGEPVRGALQGDDFDDPLVEPMAKRRAPPYPASIFAPEPVLHTRVSTRRCYWSRCTFCTQNSKYDDPGAPGKADASDTVERLQNYQRAGFGNIIFADEAISPALLRALCQTILQNGLRIDWACRCKLEHALDAELLELAAQAGCKEILFGLETVSEPLLKKMDKVVEGETAALADRVFRAVGAAGIGIHVNLISGFPGETLEEAQQTIRFVTDQLQSLPNATFRLNRFAVFPDTPISTAPWRFGISALSGRGDMPSAYAYRLDARTRRRTSPVMRAFDALAAELNSGLGWSSLTAAPGGQAALDLYAGSGHSAIFKALSQNPLDRVRTETRPIRSPPMPARRRRAFLTGATGNVGGAVLKALLAEHWEVSALTREPSGLPLGCDQIRADLYDLPDLSDVLDGVDAIFHCASPRSLNRQDMLLGDVEATGRLLDAWSSGTFVYASSQTVYGVPESLLSEQSALRPDTWYDLAKIANEHQLAFTGAALGGVGVALRLPLVFGCGPRRRDRQYLPALFDALRGGKSFLFRDEAAMANDGSAYIGEVDVARATIAAAGVEHGGAYNVAGGFVTWSQLIRIMGEMAGLRPRFSFRADGSVRENEFRLPRSRSEFDTSKFERETLFRPTSCLDEIIEAFVREELEFEAGGRSAQAMGSYQ